MSIVKATIKGQVVIPAEIRRKYHITKGTKVIIIDKDGEIILKPFLFMLARFISLLIVLTSRSSNPAMFLKDIPCANDRLISSLSFNDNLL